MTLLVGKAINLVRIKNESAPALAAAQVHDSLSSFIESLVAPPASHAVHDYSIYILLLRLPRRICRVATDSQLREQSRDSRISESTDGKIVKLPRSIQSQRLKQLALVVGEGQLLFVTKTPSVQ